MNPKFEREKAKYALCRVRNWTENYQKGNSSCYKFCRKEKFMEKATNDKMETNIMDEGKGKRKWGSRIYNFLAYGGIILVLIGGFVIYIIIHILIK